MSGLTLYNLNDTLLQYIDRMGQAETIEEQESLSLEMAPLLEAVVRKVDSFCQFCAHLEAQVALGKAEEKRLAERRKRLESHLDRLEQYALRVLDMAGADEMEGESNTLRKRLNPPSLRVTDETLIPAEYTELIPATTRVDAIRLKAALKAKKVIPGAELVRGIRLERK